MACPASRGDTKGGNANKENKLMVVFCAHCDKVKTPAIVAAGCTEGDAHDYQHHWVVDEEALADAQARIELLQAERDKLISDWQDHIEYVDTPENDSWQRLWDEEHAVSEGAVDTAIRIVTAANAELATLRAERERLTAIVGFALDATDESKNNVPDSLRGDRDWWQSNAGYWYEQAQQGYRDREYYSSQLREAESRLAGVVEALGVLRTWLLTYTNFAANENGSDDQIKLIDAALSATSKEVR